MVTGGSYGGYMALAAATNYNDSIRCALDVVGISNYNTFLKNTERLPPRSPPRRIRRRASARDGGILR